MGQVILDLLQVRNGYIERIRLDDDEYVDQYSGYAAEIENVAHVENVAHAMCSGAVVPRNNEERFNASLLVASSVLQDLLNVCESACDNRTYNYSRFENEINDYFRDMLRAIIRS